jgi:hypothetical protein
MNIINGIFAEMSSCHRYLHQQVKNKYRWAYNEKIKNERFGPG